MTAVDPATGAPVSATGPGRLAGKLGFKVDFSCRVSACQGAKVALDPTQLDPNLGYYRLLVRSGFVPPATGGTITGTDAAGFTVALGDLAAGQAGSFTVEYAQAAKPGDRKGNASQYNGWAVANFPIGFPIVQRATGDAATSAGPLSATSAPVEWQNTVPTPDVLQHGLANPVAADTDYTYKVYMGSGCAHTAYDATWVRLVSSDPYLCAEKYRVTHRLPPGVELVSATDGPTVTGTSSEGLVLTWTRDRSSWTPTDNAEAGWQTTDTRYITGASPRSVTVRFPASAFAPAGQACDWQASTQPWSTEVSIGYIGMPGETGVTKTASHTGNGVSVRCSTTNPPENPDPPVEPVPPFGKAVADPKTSTFDGATRLPNGDSPVLIPSSGAPNEKQWRITVGNQANVPGVAVVTDDALDLADAPVHRIETTPVGASVAWTATDGKKTVSGTAAAPVDAPEGYRFTGATVTSPSLAGPNTTSGQTARSDFSVVYKYRVSSSAPAGERRTNQASALMTYPDQAGVKDVALTVAPHTIQFVAPFGKSETLKGSSPGTLGDGAYAVSIPTSGSTPVSWFVDAGNGGNVPGTAVIEESDLAGPGGLPVTSINAYVHNGTAWAASAATVEYTLDNGAKATASLAAGQTFTAPAGRSIAAARVTSDPLPGINSSPAGTAQTTFRANFSYAVPATATPDATRTNTATVTMTYPDHPGVDSITTKASATTKLVGTTSVFTATVTRQPLAGGATSAGPATSVGFTVSGSTSGVPAGRGIAPQYVFVAPAGWTLVPGSASFAAGAVPAGTQFAYRTVTIAGVQRQAVVASWPSGTSFGMNATLPAMSVSARPGVTMPSGTVSRPDAYIGNSAEARASDVFTNPYTDAADLDNDGNTAERFATAVNTGAATTVALQPSLQVLKEICLPDEDAPDGCDWIADPDNRVGVAPNSTSIKYRLSVRNLGNTTLGDVVGYDVLPYVGDTGTSELTGSLPRGSTFRVSVKSVTTPTNGAVASFSGSTQPCRPEVDATVTGCADDWSSTAEGAQAIRLSLPGDLGPGQRISMEYTAAVHDAPANGAIACNSFAVRVSGLATTSEPAAVCAAIEETDLAIVAGAVQLQQGRPGVLPLTITNHGGAPSAMGKVEVSVPAGLTVTDLAPAGWTCTAVDAAGEPVFGTVAGPAKLTCVPVGAFVKDVPVALNIPVVATSPSFTVKAEVIGQVYDRDLDNNIATIAVTAASPVTGLEVNKDDGVVQAKPGDVLSYTITVRNPMMYEGLRGVTVIDQLPAGTEFVSASDGGANSGDTVSWSIADLGPESSVTRTVSVRVLPTVAVAELVNVARASAPDPAPGSGALLTGRGEDRDSVVTRPELSLTKSATEESFDASGQVVHYRLTARNIGDVTLSEVKVDDHLKGISVTDTTWPGTAGVLAPGETVIVNATYTTDQNDVDAGKLTNTADVTGRTPDLMKAPKTSVTHELPSAARPHLSFEKTVSGSAAAPGDVVTYTFTVRNDGGVTLREIDIDDRLEGLSSLDYDWPGTSGTLAPGQSASATATYTLRQGDIDSGELTNSATVTGTPRVGEPITATDSVTVPIARTPGISLEKRVAHEQGTRGAAGERLLYSFTIENTGNVTLTGVEIADRLPGLSKIGYTWPGEDGVLPPGKIATATADYTIRQADVDRLVGVTNTATVTAATPGGGTVSAESSATASTPTSAGIEIVETATLTSTDAPRVGDLVHYEFAATNVGDVTLHDVVIDPALPKTASTKSGSTIAPAEVVRISGDHPLTQDDIDAGFVTHSSTVTGKAPDEASVTDDDSSTVVLRAAPAVTLEKTGTRSGSPLGAAVGDKVAYSFTVTNTGNVTLRDVTLADPMPGLSDIAYAWPDIEGVLAPDAVLTATATYTLTAADIRAGSVSNTATVSTDRGATADDTFVLGTPAIPLPPSVVKAIDDTVGMLASTGVQVTGMAVLAAISFGAGLLLLLMRRRQRRGVVRE